MEKYFEVHGKSKLSTTADEIITKTLALINFFIFLLIVVADDRVWGLVLYINTWWLLISIFQNRQVYLVNSILRKCEKFSRNRKRGY